MGVWGVGPWLARHWVYDVADGVGHEESVCGWVGGCLGDGSFVIVGELCVWGCCGQGRG